MENEFIRIYGTWVYGEVPPPITSGYLRTIISGAFVKGSIIRYMDAETVKNDSIRQER